MKGTPINMSVCILNPFIVSGWMVLDDGQRRGHFPAPMAVLHENTHGQDPFSELRKRKMDPSLRQVRKTKEKTGLQSLDDLRMAVTLIMSCLPLLQHNVILGAIEELIKDHHSKVVAGGRPVSDHQPTPNEYFAALMTALEANDQSHTPEVSGGTMRNRQE